jgi:type IV pilus assembly protein PilB
VRDDIYENYKALAKHYGLAFANLAAGEIKAELIELVPVELARKHEVIPVVMRDGVLLLATSNPRDLAIEDLRHLLVRDVAPVVAEPEAIAAALDRYYGPEVPSP